MDSDISSSVRHVTAGHAGPAGDGPQRRTWAARYALAAVAVAAVVAAFGGAAIYAATSGASNNWPGPHGPGPGGSGGMGAGMTGSRDGARGPADNVAPAGVLHGHFVVPDGNGGYATELTQTGVLTEVSDTSITARSADGFTQTYIVAPRGTVNPHVAVNDTVTIKGVQLNDTVRVVSVNGPDGDAPPPAPPGPPPGQN